MYKSDLIDAVAEKTGETKKIVEEIINTQIEVISNELQNGEEKKVTLTGFGTFETRHRSARKGRNPQTGAEIFIPASETVGFRVGKTLKEQVNE